MRRVPLCALVVFFGPVVLSDGASAQNIDLSAKVVEWLNSWGTAFKHSAEGTTSSGNTVDVYIRERNIKTGDVNIMAIHCKLIDQGECFCDQGNVRTMFK